VKHTEHREGREPAQEADPIIAELSRALHALRSEISSRSVVAVESNGKRYRSFPSAQKFMQQLWKLQEQFRIPVHSLPTLSIPEDESLEDIHAGYDARNNVVYIPERAWVSANDPYQLGDKVGEEVFGHCYRYHHLCRYGEKPDRDLPGGGKVERGDVEEFYGFLGRKIFLRMLRERKADRLFFPHGLVTPPKDAAVVDAEIQSLRQCMAGWLVPNRQQMQSEIVSKQCHREGYSKAQTFDVDAPSWERIKEMYSMQSEDAAQRFLM